MVMQMAQAQLASTNPEAMAQVMDAAGESAENVLQVRLSAWRAENEARRAARSGT